MDDKERRTLIRIAAGDVHQARRPSSGRWEFEFRFGTTRQERADLRAVVDALIADGVAEVREYDQYRADVVLTDAGRALIKETS